MKNICLWLLVCGILAACTCGGRTNECNNERMKLTLLTNIHNDPTCGVISNKGVMMYEAAKLIIDTHNMKNDNWQLDISIMDTCGSIAGSIKATMTALVSAGLTCIHPPRHLGFIGPESQLNVDAIQKVTSVLNIPHIVKTHRSSSPYLHHLAGESEYYIIQGILEVIEALRWNSFALITRKYNDDNHDDDIQIIAKKVTMAAVAKGLCVLIHDEDNFASVASSHIVYIGMPRENFFSNVNGTILIASEGSISNYASKIVSGNSILILEDSRNDFATLESRVIHSEWWANHNIRDKYHPEELRDIRWLKEAIDVYITSLNVLCKKSKCKNEINPSEWNTILATVIATHNAKEAISPKKLSLLLKRPRDKLEDIGEILVLNNQAQLQWISDDADDDNNIKNKNTIPDSLSDIISSPDEKVTADCAKPIHKITETSNDNDDDVVKIIFAAFDEHEWWTMVAIVGGVGITMFTVGFIAVYIVYTNIRGPKTIVNNKGRRRISRDLSLHQVTTPVHAPAPPPPPPRSTRQQISRRDSNLSIRSTLSDKSV